MKSFAGILAVAACAMCVSSTPVPVSQLNVTQYLGRWYQPYASWSVTQWFEKDATCVSAFYSLRSDGKVGVLNTQRDGSPSNPTKNITGYAYIPDPSKPGELLVHLEGVPIDAPYWVLETGPIVNGLYDYSIVSDSFQVTLFLLVRDLERYHAKYEDYLNKRLEQLGFTNFLNKPVKIVQDGCWN